jgi:hypothetical protein
MIKVRVSMPKCGSSALDVEMAILKLLVQWHRDGVVGNCSLVP